MEVGAVFVKSGELLIVMLSVTDLRCSLLQKCRILLSEVKLEFLTCLFNWFKYKFVHCLTILLLEE